MSYATNSVISIIVPIYNAEKLLNECIISIIEQEDDNIELILVNDGSIDNSDLICQNYVNDKRVKYIKIENSGVSNARNIGLKNASGEWICFVDADDKLMSGALKKIRPLLTADVEVLYCNYQRSDENIKYTDKVSLLDSSLVIEASFDYIGCRKKMFSFFTMRHMIFTPCWGKIYRRSIIESNEIVFSPELKLSEDLCFNIKFLGHCRIIKTFDFPMYFYRINLESVTHQYSVDYIKNRELLFDYLCSREILDNVCESAKRKYILLNVLRMNEKIFNTKPREIAIKLYKKIVDKPIVKSIVKKASYGRLSEGRVQDLYYKLILSLLKKDKVLLAVRVGYWYCNLKPERY